MGINWNKYPREKHAIKLQYLKLRKRLVKGETFNIRKEITDWALKKYPHLPRPKRQFGGSFDHSTQGIFFREHGFVVTLEGVRAGKKRPNLTEIEYIDVLISRVKSAKSSFKKQSKKKLK
jgi:hypothetical protein